MKEEFELSLKKFGQASERLSEVLDSDLEHSIVRDSAVKRFEFTYELCWKTLKLYYAVKGKSLRYARDVFKEAFSDGLISDEQLFLDMLEDRNKTVHVYDQQDVERIYEHIKGRYYNALDGIHKKVKSMN